MAQDDGREDELVISLRTSSGHGQTALSAFDDALWGAGVADFNLIRLSSVIPGQARITFDTDPVAGEHGDRLYCVYAAAYAEDPGATAWAGIGWTRQEDGRGLFVEHAASSQEELLELIDLSLTDLVKRRGGGYGEFRSVTASARYDDQPACALAVATYRVAGWGRS